MELSKNTKSAQFGLAHWMQRVIEECDTVGADFAPDPVHDLRVALRRCRSMADGLMTVDPHPAWKQMKKAGKQLFAQLGALRDAHVMTEWIQRLGSPHDPVSKTLFDFVAAQEQVAKQNAISALKSFDRKEWKKWSELLSARAQRVRATSPVFKHLALERWTEAYALHQKALRNRSQVSFHRLRIGLKKFRYIVENFLPPLHEKWADDLKELQDLLGEVHDLDVLWAIAMQIKAFPDAAARDGWRAKIAAERGKRLEKYGKKMVGKTSLWPAWRAELPQGAQVERAAMERLRTWASLLDPDFGHAQQVAKLALQLYDGLPPDGLVRGPDHQRVRSILQAAALLHDVGRAKGRKKHHKASARLIRKLDSPLGWRPQDLQMAAVVARYHRGSLPQATMKRLQPLSEGQRRTAIFLAGILRLADAMDQPRDKRVNRLRVEGTGDFTTIWAEGQALDGRQLEAIAGARHLLEVVYDRPFLVRSRPPGEERRKLDRRRPEFDRETGT
jgi:CHAD domain-containing protein